MKASKFSDAQIAFVSRQAERGTAIGEATFYNWRTKYAGLMPSEMKRLRQLEEENGKLKKLVADLSPARPRVVNEPPITLVNRSEAHGPPDRETQEAVQSTVPTMKAARRRTDLAIEREYVGGRVATDQA